MDLPINLEVENQLDMFETEVNGEGVGDEELDINSDDEDEIAGDVATSNTATVIEIICDADESICLDHLPSDEANLGRVSIAKVRPCKIFLYDYSNHSILSYVLLPTRLSTVLPLGRTLSNAASRSRLSYS